MHACPHGWIRLIGQYAAAYFVKCFGTGKKRPRGGPRESPPAGEGRRRFATAGRFLCSACFTGRKNLVFSPTGQASRIYVSPVCLNFATNAISVPP